jgi:hypothetical protein
MRTTVDGIEIEGTPAEFAELLASLRATQQASEKNGETQEVDVVPAGRDGISEQFAYRALRRLPLSEAQKGFLKALRESSPKWVLSSALQEALNCSPTSLGGVMGGLGRRVSATKGFRPEFGLWEWKWDEDEGQFAYRLPPTVVGALDRLKA